MGNGICSFHLNFLVATNVELLVVCLLATVDLLYPFLSADFYFLLSCMGPSHMMKTGLLSKRWFATAPCVPEKSMHSAVVGCSNVGCVGLVAYSVVRISYCFC